MAGVIHGTAAWPGIGGVESCTMTLSHGITPATAVLRALPGPLAPAAEGTLVISDNNETVTLNGCRVSYFEHEQDEHGTIWQISILDRRWRWAEMGAINGFYNQLDNNGKLIPWTIRSPTELAVLCLEAMGEGGYTVNLPPGLPSSIGNALPSPDGFLPTGYNYPPTGTNPPINWNAIPPAQALAQVADMFGCRVIYQVSTDTVYVGPIGDGTALPPGSLHRQGPSLHPPETPDAVGVIGAPTRYQMRLALEPVGLEWNGSYQPINLLSYAPQTPGTKQVTSVIIAYDQTTAGLNYTVFLGAFPGTPANTGAAFTFTPIPGQGANDIAQALALFINASLDPRVRGLITASSSGLPAIATLTLTGGQVGVPFSVAAPRPVPITAGDSMTVVTDSVATPDTADWSLAPPPLFSQVRETPRLTFEQAMSLAQRSVWRCFRVSDTDASGAGLIQVPGYGKLVRRQQLVLQDTQVDQIVPEAGNPNILTKGFAQPLIKDLYNGLSRDKPAAVFGSVAKVILARAGYSYVKADTVANTAPDDLVPIPFTIDSVQQVVTFSSYVFRIGDAPFALAANAGGGQSLLPDNANNFQADNDRVGAPDLLLQTAVLVRNPITNQLEAFTKVLPLDGAPGTTGTHVEIHPDVQLNVTSVYDNTGTILSVGILEADPILRANFYLQGLAAQYQIKGGQTVEYNGIRAIDLDGAIAQVTWTVGPGGASTTASRNAEHHVWVPPYPARRRAELLAGVVRNPQDQQRVDFTLQAD
jgi:hypothetical protein